ncbi:MAG: general secretion pathway protein GspB [Gammaproteobacteria bacterium]|nr:general secretion pathway protein GspB [Gammaproteobacteria bacterium]
MSFVLQALQKQEAAGDAAAAVSLAQGAAQRRRHRLWMALFAVAMAVNAGLLVWLFGVPRWNAVAPAETAAGSAQPAAVVIESRPADTEPAIQPPRPEPTASESPRPAAAAPPAPRRVSLQALPAEARQRFPGIAFSTHIYAEDADLRAIVANGERLTEGERIRGLEIVEITEGGVLLAFERYLVEVPIATDWD